MQALLLHSTSDAQVAAVALRGRHALVATVQYCPIAQGSAALQPDEHCVPFRHWFEAQAVATAGVHEPAPLHAVAAVLTPAEQDAPAHCIALPGYLHCVESVPSHRLAHVPAPAQGCRVVPRGVPAIVTH